MSNWIGIRVSAVLTILGSGATLLFAGFMVWTALRSSQLETRVETPLPLKAIMLTMAVCFTALSAWGIATAIGIFRRRGWARLSMIIFAILLVGMGGSALVGILFIKLPPTGNVSDQTMQNIRVGIAAFYGSMAVIGAWWLLLFNSSATKRYFAERPAEPGSRPLSVAIIGWYLLLCAVGTATGAILRMPGMLFGAIVTGWAALAVYTAFTAVEIYLGAGLLQLQESARIASIVWFALMAVNSVVTVMLPGFAGRMQIMQQALPAFLRVGQPVPVEGTGGLMLMATLIVAVPIWFLVRRREAFRA